MTAFFTIPDMIVDLLKPDNTHQITESENQSYSCCGQILDLVRSDSMGYVAFTGNPFCNSAKYCEYLCH